MRRCIYHTNQWANIFSSWFMMIVLIVCAAFLFWVDIQIALRYLAHSEMPGMELIMYSLFVWGVFAVFALIFLELWLMMTRTYRFSENGIYTGGLFRKARFYSWEQVHHIGIYAYGATASMNGFFSGICIFLMPMPDQFAYRSMKALYWLARQRNRLIVIDDSEGVRAELASVYFGEVKDHRLRQLKLHDRLAYERFRKELE